MDEEDAWSVPISALQHYLYCPRQCGLIHLDQIWSENIQTAQGRLMHQRADQSSAGRRRGVRTVTAMPLNHPILRIHGAADVVEFAGESDDSPVMPVEYKRGRPKQHRADEVQLCAQAMCLEHMLNQQIDRGEIYYGEQRRRHEVAIDGQLRSLTEAVIASVKAMFESGLTPVVGYSASRCDRCSLLEDCRPQSLGRRSSVRAWLELQLKV